MIIILYYYSIGEINFRSTRYSTPHFRYTFSDRSFFSCERDLSVNIDIERDVKNWVNLKKKRVTFDT